MIFMIGTGWLNAWGFVSFFFAERVPIAHSDGPPSFTITSNLDCTLQLLGLSSSASGCFPSSCLLDKLDGWRIPQDGF